MMDKMVKVGNKKHMHVIDYKKTKKKKKKKNIKHQKYKKSLCKCLPSSLSFATSKLVDV
jgi:hypothetical protein